MGKTLKMELRRLFRDKFFYVYPGAMFLILIIGALTADPTHEVHLLEIFYSSYTPFFLAVTSAAIMVIVHCSDEDKNGYSKNLMGSIGGRQNLTIAKLIIGAITMVIYSAINFLGVFGEMVLESTKLVNGTYAYPESPDMMLEKYRDQWISREQFAEEMKSLVSYEVAHYILLTVAGIATIAFAIMLYEVLRSAVFSYVMIMLICFEILEMLIANVIALIFDGFEIGRYLLFAQFGYFGDASNPGDPVWTFWVRNLIYVALFSGAAIFASKKKDAV